MSETSHWNILHIFFAFRSRQIRSAIHEGVVQQLKHFPPHLLDDVDARMTADKPAR
jgi:hypothetical protein